MQVLGGDPEAAYVTVVFAAGYAAGLAAARPPVGVAAALLRRMAVGLVPVYLGLLGALLVVRACDATPRRSPQGTPAPVVAADGPARRVGVGGRRGLVVRRAGSVEARTRGGSGR